jgi:epoxyqueuosine reductase
LNNNRYTELIKNEAIKLGFSHVGIAKAGLLKEDALRLEKWLKNSFHGKMGYMENHFDKRIDPTKLVDDAKSVITLIYNYFPEEKQHMNPKIAKYAYGEDYHIVIREKTNQLLETIRNEIGEVQGRGFVDSAPVLERAWAVQSGLGWVGKNGNLIIPKTGSFFFIATLIVDLELDYNLSFSTNHCGSCTKCIDACPTEAILENKVIDASKCISYFTIELKDALIPSKQKWTDWMFGCDVCQDVCPWNKFSIPTQEEKFKPINEILNYTIKDWNDITETEFKTIFKNSAIKRTKFEGIKRNLKFITA